MGYLIVFNANKLVELEDQNIPLEEQVEELQLTEAEQVELEAL